jgi:glutathione S-transferase
MTPRAPAGLRPYLRRSWAAFFKTLAGQAIDAATLPMARRLWQQYEEREQMLETASSRYARQEIDKAIRVMEQRLRIGPQFVPDEPAPARPAVMPWDDDMSTPQSEEEADRWAAMDALLDRVSAEQIESGALLTRDPDGTLRRAGVPIHPNGTEQ